MYVSRIIDNEEWQKRKNRRVMCDSCLKVRKPKDGFCTKCGMSLVAVDELVEVNNMDIKFTSELIEYIKTYIVDKVEEDGKTGKDLTLSYILGILEEAKNERS